MFRQECTKAMEVCRQRGEKEPKLRDFCPGRSDKYLYPANRGSRAETKVPDTSLARIGRGYRVWVGMCPHLPLAVRPAGVSVRLIVPERMVRLAVFTGLRGEAHSHRRETGTGRV